MANRTTRTDIGSDQLEPNEDIIHDDEESTTDDIFCVVDELDCIDLRTVAGGGSCPEDPAGEFDDDEQFIGLGGGFGGGGAGGGW